MKILLTGANGQLGQQIVSEFLSFSTQMSFEIIQCTREELDLFDYDACKSIVEYHKPDWVINAGAYTNVDKAETEPDIAYQVNAQAPAAFVEALTKYGGQIIQISSDYVFNGDRSSPYKTSDLIQPLSVYGKSKARGEEFVLAYEKGIVIRSGWVYGPVGNNFLLKMIQLHSEESNKHRILKVVSDQIGSPTSTKNLAIAILRSIMASSSKNIPKILHFSDAGVASWYDFAIAISAIAIEIDLFQNPLRIEPIQSKNYKTLAKRPNYSVLDCFATYNALKMKPFHWRDSLSHIMKGLNK